MPGYNRKGLAEKLRVALVCAILLFVTVSKVNAMDSSLITSGSIAMRILDIRDETDGTIKINYGDTIRIKVVYPADSDSVQYLDIMDRDYNNSLIERYVLNPTGFQIVNVSASTYAPATNFTIRVYAGKTSEELRTDLLNITIVAKTSRPLISLTIKNPSEEIAEGDYVVIHGTISTSEYSWTLEGPYDYGRFYRIAEDAVTEGIKHPVKSWETECVVTTDEHRIKVKLPTSTILNECRGAEGQYSFKVWNAAYPNDVEEVVFRISPLYVQVQVEEEVKLGQKMMVYGSTNAAESGSEFDDTDIGSNTVTIKMYREQDNSVANCTVRVRSDGSFQKEIQTQPKWESGTYTVMARVSTGNGYSAEDYTFIEVRPPEAEVEEEAQTPVTPAITKTVEVTPTVTKSPVPAKTAQTPKETPTTFVETPPETKEKKEKVEIPGFELVLAITALMVLLYTRRYL